MQVMEKKKREEAADKDEQAYRELEYGYLFMEQFLLRRKKWSFL